MARASGPLTQERLADLADASLGNARMLLADAERLAEAGSVATSYSMAILAGEEFGKCQVAIGAVGRVDADAAYWKDFWKAIYDHKTKLLRAADIMLRWLPEKLVDRFVAILGPAVEQQRREAGLYVDVVNGAIVTPDEAITEDEAANAVETVGTIIDFYVELFGDDLVEAYGRSLPNAVRMREALDSLDRDEIRRVWAETTDRVLSEGELERMLELLTPSAEGDADS